MYWVHCETARAVTALAPQMIDASVRVWHGAICANYRVQGLDHDGIPGEQHVSQLGLTNFAPVILYLTTGFHAATTAGVITVSGVTQLHTEDPDKNGDA